jgi:hypothetical protein
MIRVLAGQAKSIKNVVENKLSAKPIFNGLLETESLINPLLVNALVLKKMSIEYHPDSVDGKYWHVCRVEVPAEQMQKLSIQLSKEIKYGWYSVFWNSNDVIVVFANKIFSMLRHGYQDSGEYKRMRNYGIANGVQEKYMTLQID